ncbi:sucrase ferredoxin [Lipingzhangella sp. LS1_29]|uniref:Sucrase ferredoxin n=1 Tax=Lipingzhangella rawalii TaxID=2055835 RepID=A0ABU2H134_9ACTN|nr:sucrase ferredoxin [Lipingzhangella rawalii]MDS1269013.1 sucrase ferredoxin [Lipingzhangella rawalii]
MRLPSAPDGTRGCAAIGRYLNEPIAGTAAHATGWILLEHPGTWGANALADSVLDPAVATRLAELSTELPIRAQLIRRPDGRSRPNGGPRTAYLAHSGRDGPWLRRLDLAEPRALLDLDLPAVLRPEPPGVGTQEPEPIHLVCTHAKKDACCAMLGRPVAEALAAAGRQVWETSHVGGHRFAGNLVTLPHGLYFGRLDPPAALRVTEKFASGRLDVRHLRGRCADRPEVQAAEAALRSRLGIDALDAVQPLCWETTSEGHVVTLRADATEHTVRLRTEPTQPRMPSCAAVEPVADVTLRPV